MRDGSSGVGAIDTGQLIAGHYRLVAHIGSGAMGVVWRAVDERLERSVAVKQILAQPGLSESERANVRQRAMREAKNAARFQHPNAIVVFDIAEYDGDPCLVMEYMPSRSLSAVLAVQPTLELSRVASIGKQVASALVVAHRAGIVHRDIKPGNILLDENGTAKITDFGISRAAGDLTLTQTGLIGGTPAYLAPELARGSDPTPASDVFSLGATLYHALEGQPPYGNSTNQLALLYTAANGQVVPPKRAGKATALLMSLLRVEPGDRPSMSDARRELATLAADHPSSPGTLVSPPLYQPGRQPVASLTDPPGGAAPAERPPWQRTGNSASADQPLPTPTATFITPGSKAGVAKNPGSHDAKRKGILIGSLAAAVVTVAVVTFLLLNSGGGNNQTQPPQPSTSSAVPPPSQPPPSSSTAPAGLGQTPNENGPVGFSQAGNLVIAYFGGNGSADSWNMLTAAAQQVFGSQENFQNYWQQRGSPTVSFARADRGLNADGSVDMFVNIDGAGRKGFRVVGGNAGLRIDADTRID